jgi:hypothetical protein
MKFSCSVTRQILQRAVVEVEAESADAAYDKVFDMSETDLDWSEDTNVPQQWDIQVAD